MSANLENARSRKWQLTINNPLDHGFDHDVIKDKLSQMKSMLYWCMCDEEGDECETLHTHIYICWSAYPAVGLCRYSSVRPWCWYV